METAVKHLIVPATILALGACASNKPAAQAAEPAAQTAPAPRSAPSDEPTEAKESAEKPATAPAPGDATAEGVPGRGLAPDEARALYLKLSKEKNECPNGLPGLVGTWRFIGESKAEAFQDEIAFHGPDFTEWMSEGPANARRKAILEGRYTCIYKNRVLFELKRVEPDGAFDNHAGDTWACDVLSPAAPDGPAKLLLVCFFDWKLDLRTAMEFEYQRASD
ncbi:MAG: hypothetical protein AMXMBFR64_45110 [Myxococcales bacterium]